jgi:hypothetical protein
MSRPAVLKNAPQHDSVAEWSKASDSSSDGAIRVGSNPTAVNFLLRGAGREGTHVQNATYRDRTCDLEVNSLTL